MLCYVCCGNPHHTSSSSHASTQHTTNIYRDLTKYLDEGRGKQYVLTLQVSPSSGKGDDLPLPNSAPPTVPLTVAKNETTGSSKRLSHCVTAARLALLASQVDIGRNIYMLYIYIVTGINLD